MTDKFFRFLSNVVYWRYEIFDDISRFLDILCGNLFRSVGDGADVLWRELRVRSGIMFRQLESGRQLPEPVLLPEQYDDFYCEHDDIDKQLRVRLHGIGQREFRCVRGAACLPDGYLCPRQLRLPEGHAGLLHVERKQYDELYDQCLHKCGHRVFLLHFERLRDRL